MNNVRVILWKEWLELRQQRALLLGLVLLPVLFTLMPLMLIYGAGHVPQRLIDQAGRLPEVVLSNPSLKGLTPREIGQALIGQQLSLLFMMMPLIVPTTIAAYSIVGEKTHRTLEPLLATPVRTWELLLAKSLAALLPAVGITWVAGAVFAVGIVASAVTPRVLAAILRPEWAALLLIGTPLIALFAIAITIIISSRVTDARTAQQVAGTVVLPITGIMFAQLVGVLVLSPVLVFTGLAGLALLSTLTLWAATQFFRREVILTRWR